MKYKENKKPMATIAWIGANETLPFTSIKLSARMARYIKNPATEFGIPNVLLCGAC
jgi:hypothetical protein